MISGCEVNLSAGGEEDLCVAAKERVWEIAYWNMI